MHEPLYDLYCQLLQGIGTFSVDEFDAITREEALVPRLNALDQACEARGITGLGAGDGDNVTPLARAAGCGHACAPGGCEEARGGVHPRQAGGGGEGGGGGSTGTQREEQTGA